MRPKRVQAIKIVGTPMNTTFFVLDTGLPPEKT
jgi:hypothetical protein